MTSESADDPLIKSRLIQAGVPDSDIQFRADNNGECLNYFGKSVCEKDDVNAVAFVHLKTLVWEISCVQNDVNETPLFENFYIVTAQEMSDKVDQSLLRDLIYKQQDISCKSTPLRLSMAPTDKAEALTGFQSGCMPPIGHSVPMKLYLDVSVASLDDCCIVHMGSGVFGQSLLLPLKQLLNVAENCNQGLLVGAFLQNTAAASSSLDVDRIRNGSFHAQKAREAQIAREQAKKKRIDTIHKPKDRLKEYRSFQNLVDKARILRTTARKKGRFEDMKKLLDEAIKMGDFEELMKVSANEGQGQNSLHLAAWRGDFQTVKLLVETVKIQCPDLDIINTISTGEANYGKTPIFFALTQCRDDVVRYLLSHGANLLYVNNGQTPCSIAVTHLESESCELLFEAESRQLKDGGTFVMHRSPHPNKYKLHGDLDPRFPIDPSQMGDDLKAGLLEFQQSIINANIETIYNGIPTVFSPRSIRQTTRWWKRDNSGKITYKQPRSLALQQAQNEQQEHEPRPRSPSPEKEVFQKAVDLASLEMLVIDEVLKEIPIGGPSNGESTVLVDCADTIRILELEIEYTLKNAVDLESKEGELSTDEDLLNSAWGLDCEWKPGVDFGSEHPVATLQLSSRRCAFLIDLQSICQPLHGEGKLHSIGNDTETLLGFVLEKLFVDTRLLLLGYGILQDIQKLAASFPHLSCFSHYHSVIDLQSLSVLAFPKSARQAMSSLQKMVAMLLQRRLDKTQQCSDWTRRPLSSDQIKYATLDAAVLPTLLERISEQSTIIKRRGGQFFTENPDLKLSFRFSFLDQDGNSLDTTELDGKKIEFDVPRGRLKNLFSKNIARQSWPEGHKSPDLPRAIAAKPPRENGIGSLSKKERSHLKKVGNNGKKRPKPIQLNKVPGDFVHLPVPGTVLGYTKDSCVQKVVGDAFMSNLPEDTHVGFNRRSGVVETSNAWIFFCNFGGSTGRYFSSEFLEGGKDLTFRLNPRKRSERTLLNFISLPKGMEPSDIKILLFARGSTREKYIYCGECKCQSISPKDCGSVDALLNLTDFDRLVGENKISSDFSELVQRQNHA